MAPLPQAVSSFKIKLETTQTN